MTTKKMFSQLAIVTAVLATFPLLSQATPIPDNGRYVNGTYTVTDDETLTISANRAAVGAITQDTSVTVNDGVTLSVTGTVDGPEEGRKGYAYGASTAVGHRLDFKGNLKVDIGTNADGLNAIGLYFQHQAGLEGNLDITARTVVKESTAYGLFAGVGIAQGQTITLSGDTTKLTAAGSGYLEGVSTFDTSDPNAGNGVVINFNADETKIQVLAESGNSQAYGIRAYRSTMNFTGDTSVVIQSADTTDNTFGIRLQADPSDVNKTIVNFSGDVTEIKALGSMGSTAGIFTSGAEGVNISSSDIDIVASNSSSTSEYTAGLYTQYGSSIAMTNENAQVDITVNGTGLTYGLRNTVYGGNSEQAPNEFGSISIAGDSTINVTSSAGNAIGISNKTFQAYALSQSNETDGVYLTGSTVLNVNASGTNQFAYGIDASNKEFKQDEAQAKPSAKTVINNLTAIITGKEGATSIGLNGSDASSTTISGTSTISAIGEKAYGVNLKTNSELNVEGSLGISGDSEGIVMDETSSMNLLEKSSVVASSMQSTGQTTLDTDSQLTVNGAEGSSSSLGNVKGDSATVNFVGGEYSVGNLTGENSTLYVSTETVKATVVDNQSSGLFVTTNSEVTDALNGGSIDELVTFEKGGEGVKYFMPEGMYEGEQSGTYGKDGKIANRTVKVNSLMQSTLELASAAPLAMNRIMMSDLRKRMGDIRTDTNTNGAWARYEGGRLSGSNGLENDFNTIQVGGDTKLGDWRVGGSFNYTKGDVDYARGDADMDSYGLSAYGLWLGEQGQFVDIVARVSKADTDMKVDGFKTGSMDSMAYSLSGEFGWRFALNDMVYVEPQFEAAYTYVDADDLDIDTASYKFDSVNSFIGRAGFAAGLKCPDNFGDVYFHASALHEFSGDSEITGGNGSKYKMDGKDTWVEYGIGANFNINKATYVWADVQRTSGADLDEDWRANIGVRYSF